MLAARFPASLQLGCVAIVISLLIALPTGVYAAVKRGTMLDVLRTQLRDPRAVTAVVLARARADADLRRVAGLVPAAGKTTAASYISPALTMGWATTPAIMRLTRSAMLEVLESEYIKLARIKGLPEWKVI